MGLCKCCVQDILNKYQKVILSFVWVTYIVTTHFVNSPLYCFQATRPGHVVLERLTLQTTSR